MTYVLVHGAGDAAANWELLTSELRVRGREVVAVDLPCDDASAGWAAYADAVVDAVGERSDLVVVAHSLGGFTGPLVCARVPVDLLVLVAGMVPSPGETGKDWWANTEHEQAVRDQDDHDGSDLAVFFHDVPPGLAAEALANGRDQDETPMLEPWPLDAWPDVPTRYLLCREDRMFPAAWTRRHVHQRLGIFPDEIDGGHCPFLSRPEELADRLEAYRGEIQRPS
ncbi:MAG: alpha/beta hydrolase [Actinomycetota bacterium]|nr:alpha/beta hydrolase [Actinomycetota bacterium]